MGPSAHPRAVQLVHDMHMATNTMVLGDDGSPSADLAWLWINSHTWPQWRLEVINAQDPVVVRVAATRPKPVVWSPPNPRRPFADAQLDEVVHLTVESDPRVALSRPADLLVIGPRGRGLLKALHLGSTAEWLMTHPPAPIVVPRHGRHTQTVVLCHDGSLHAQAATHTLSVLPWVYQLSVTVVAVKDGRADVQRAIDDATEVLQGVGADVHHQILSGDPTNELLTYLGRHKPDLVVLGTRGLTGVRRLVIGSTAGVVAHTTDRSILLVCAEPAAGG